MLQQDIKKDLESHSLSGPKRDGIFEFAKCFIFNYGLQAMIVYRLGQWIFNRQYIQRFCFMKLIFSPIYFVLNTGIKYMYGISISRKATIGPGLYIGHFGNIRIDKCIIGENCSVQQSVHIGPEKGKGSNSPKIGSNVWIGGHVTVFGKITIADGATVSVGSNVTRDVPGNCLVVGNPARVVNKGYDNTKLLGLTQK